jgi:hypothetical protein
LSGPGAITLDGLTDETSRLWREAGVLPEHIMPRIPVALEAAAILIRAGLSDSGGRVVPMRRATPGPGLPFEPSEGELETVLLVRVSSLGASPEAQVYRLGEIAEIFDPLRLRAVRAMEAQRLESAVEATWERYQLDRERLMDGVVGPVAGIEIVQSR